MNTLEILSNEDVGATLKRLDTPSATELIAVPLSTFDIRIRLVLFDLLDDNLDLDTTRAISPVIGVLFHANLMRVILSKVTIAIV